MQNNARESQWYDDVYSAHLLNKLQYSLPAVQSMYYNIWMLILEWIRPEERIIDYGCGVGQFAELCLQNNKKYVYGCDFSEVAIDAAKIRNQELAHMFHVHDLREDATFYFAYYDVAVFCEVLEHIEFDRELLQKIPSGKRVIISLPNYMYDSHVRCYPTEKAIKERYDDILNIETIGKVKISSENCIWICDCKKI